MKRNFLPILLGLLMISAVLPSAVVFAGNDVSGRQRKQKVKESVLRVKSITGTWINLAYKDVRNRYTNPQSFDNRIRNYGKLKCGNCRLWALNIWYSWKLPMRVRLIIPLN